MSKANTRVVLLVDPKFLVDKFFEGTGVMADTRWAPFEIPRSREGYGAPDSVDVTIDRFYAPQYFFGRVREAWRNLPENKYYDMVPSPRSEDHYVDYVNCWLGIVDHFGLEADYKPEFFELIRPIILEILVSGYREEPTSEKASNDRHFNDHVYSREDFQREFNRFIMKHQLLF